MNEKKVLIYSLSTCGHCRDTINFVAQKGVEFSFIDIDLLEKSQRKEVLEELKRINPECTFPTTVIQGKTVVGYDESELEEALRQ